MKEITVPTINTNDVDAVLNQWLKEEGERVQAGEVVALLETTKATFALEASSDGILGISGVEGRRYDFGAVIGWLFTDESERQSARAAAPAETAPDESGPLITAAAQRLIDKLGITGAQLLALGKSVIRESDIQALGAPAATNAAPLSLQQQAIARTVTLSRSTIPDAFLLHKIDVEAALARLKDYQQAHRTRVGLPDLLTWVVAQLCNEFPAFFGRLDDQLRSRASSAGNIGVTLDVGHGLFVPVIRDATQLSFGAVAARLAAFRMKAMRNSFEAADLADGDLTISLNMNEGTVFVQPIILPPQTSMLSIGAVLKEVVIGNDGIASERRFVNLGVAYDHRAVNGFQAAAFAKAISALLTASDPLSS